MKYMFLGPQRLWTIERAIIVEVTLIYLLLGMASVDSSAPETTSSDNSPTLVRRNFTGGSGGATAAGHHGGPGSDSGSSQSDSVESSSSGCKHMAQQSQQPCGALKSQPNDADRYVITTIFAPVIWVTRNWAFPSVVRNCICFTSYLIPYTL